MKNLRKSNFKSRVDTLRAKYKYKLFFDQKFGTVDFEVCFQILFLLFSQYFVDFIEFRVSDAFKFG